MSELSDMIVEDAKSFIVDMREWMEEVETEASPSCKFCDEICENLEAKSDWRDLLRFAWRIIRGQR